MFSALVFLLPSFTVNLFRPNAKGRPRPRVLHPTAYLDGLRGVAAFIVYIYHFGTMWGQWISNGYGSSVNDRYLIQLPFVRLLTAGHASVTLFFAISGYVLSIRTLSFIHKGQYPRILEAISGAVFRRPFRLYLPIIVANGIIATLVQTNFPFQNNHINGFGVPITAPTPYYQFHHWLESVGHVFYVFKIHGLRGDTWDPASPYISATWTIPTEFKGSIIVFLVLLALARAKKWIRLSLVTMVGVYWQFKRGDSDMALFCAGMLAAELSIVITPAFTYEIPNRLLPWLSPRSRHRLHHAVAGFWFIIALYLLSYPDFAAPVTPGYRTLALADSYPMGAQTFWVSIASILFLFVLIYSPPARLPTRPTLGLASHEHRSDGPAGDQHRDPSTEPLYQRLFTSRLAQYLGFISYGMYLSHEAVNCSVGIIYANPGYDMTKDYYAILATLEGPARESFVTQTRWSYLMLLLPGWILNTIAVIWVGDVFTRAVDTPCVRLTRLLGKWVESDEARETR